MPDVYPLKISQLPRMRKLFSRSFGASSLNGKGKTTEATKYTQLLANTFITKMKMRNQQEPAANSKRLLNGKSRGSLNPKNCQRTPLTSFAEGIQAKARAGW